MCERPLIRRVLDLRRKGTKHSLESIYAVVQFHTWFKFNFPMF